MKVIHEKTIYQLIFLPLLFPVNCYLVEEADSLTLIDAALPFSYKGILRMSNKLKKPITRILLTHVHEDHVGALDSLKGLLPNATIYVSERDSRLMAGDITLDKDEPDMPIRGSIPKKLNTRADVLLKEGDQIGSLVAVSTPGHTPGSFSYLDTRNNVLIVGDAFQTRGGIAVGGQIRPLFPFPAMATWNQELALISAKKLRKCEPTLLAAGHGKMIEEPQSAMDLAIAAAERNLICALQKRSK
ncbi:MULTISPECIES: MBL fold metallo-hydrolase [unclassified Clostridium]|uniref:MBL fold metallo-hydrolase n=1 Tax=unclassified Clostridium TaxID=2614128 RepID=UPI00029869F5|nr:MULTISPECIES: MBL fold metallo-hydrolase [unclassified Clostridium]EKQ51476.1 MAG: Zn-dependent hydrolase, glyoxylase [Clostridium sp. Maddingley MBC34-26]